MSQGTKAANTSLKSGHDSYPFRSIFQNQLLPDGEPNTGPHTCSPSARVAFPLSFIKELICGGFMGKVRMGFGVLLQLSWLVVRQGRLQIEQDGFSLRVGIPNPEQSGMLR